MVNSELRVLPKHLRATQQSERSGGRARAHTGGSRGEGLGVVVNFFWRQQQEALARAFSGPPGGRRGPWRQRRRRHSSAEMRGFRRRRDPAARACSEPHATGNETVAPGPWHYCQACDSGAGSPRRVLEGWTRTRRSAAA